MILSMGLLGAIPFIVCVLYSLTWITRFANLQETFSMAFSLHAIAIVFIILLASVTEPFLGGKLGPVAMIFVPIRNLRPLPDAPPTSIRSRSRSYRLAGALPRPRARAERR